MTALYEINEEKKIKKSNWKNCYSKVKSNAWDASTRELVIEKNSLKNPPVHNAIPSK